MDLNISSESSQNPNKYLETAYAALKGNVPATQRILQAAQQGQDVGLAGIGAMAAQRFQQKAADQQKAQQAQQMMQSPQPTVLQQLQAAAMQGGIMGQLPGSIQMAQAPQAPQGSMGLGDIPVSPATLPQQGMAGGGLVALAQGGYLDVDGGDAYAQGGSVRGFAGGGRTLRDDLDETFASALVGDVLSADPTVTDEDFLGAATQNIAENPFADYGSEEAQIDEAEGYNAEDDIAAQRAAFQELQNQRAASEGPTAEEMRDRILALRGGMPSGMSDEEKAWRQEQIEEANTDKWLQTLAAIGGGVFAGGGRNWGEAAGQGLLYGLNAYRQGATAEGEAELGMLQAQSAYAEAQRKAQERAADEMFGIEKEQMKLGSAAQIARAKAKADWAKTEFTEAGKDRRAQLNAIAVGAKDAVTRDKAIAEMVKMEVEEATKLNPAISPEEVDAIRAKYYQYYGATPPGLGGGQGLSGGMGLGNVPTITKTGTIIPART